MSALCLILLSSLLLVSCTDYPVRYDGHQVIRLSLTNSTAHMRSVQSQVISIAEHAGLDVWASSLIDGWVDIKIPPHLTNSIDTLFKNIPYEVKINDVQADIERNELQRSLARIAPLDFFDDFQTYGDIYQWISEQETAHQSIVKKISIGNTFNSLPIHALQIGGSSVGSIVIHCGIHAREWISPSTCCWIIDQILNQDPEGPSLYQKYSIIIIPVLNADGYDYTHTTDRLWRKNRQLNSGTSCIGTDLNRNFDYDFGGSGASSSPCSDIYHGRTAYSAPESKAVSTLLNSLSSVPAYIDIHAYGALWMSPWGYNCQSVPPDYGQMGATMQASVNAVRAVNGRSYVYGPGCQTIYKTSGDCCDDSYGNLGIIDSYTIEAFGNSFTPNPSQIPLVGSEIYAGVKQTIKLLK